MLDVDVSCKVFLGEVCHGGKERYERMMLGVKGGVLWR